VLTQCQLLFFAVLAFTWLMRTGLYPPELASTNLDVEWLYRRLLPRSALFVRRFLSGLALPLGLALEAGKERAVAMVLRFYGPQGLLARDPLVSMATFVVMAMFAAVLVLMLMRGL
jgi:multicomponent Na+:H+ antiporter subunit D